MAHGGFAQGSPGAPLGSDRARPRLPRRAAPCYRRQIPRLRPPPVAYDRKAGDPLRARRAAGSPRRMDEGTGRTVLTGTTSKSSAATHCFVRFPPAPPSPGFEVRDRDRQSRIRADQRASSPGKQVPFHEGTGSRGSTARRRARASTRPTRPPGATGDTPPEAPGAPGRLISASGPIEESRARPPHTP